MALAREQEAVDVARDNLGRALDEVEAKFHPSHLSRVGSWWFRRSTKRHPVIWTGVVVGAFALVVGLVSWAVLDSSRED